MRTRQIVGTTMTTLALAAALVALAPSVVATQRHGAWKPQASIEEGTQIRVRTTRDIDERRPSGRVYPGIVEEDVRDRRGRLAIPRGAAAELTIRRDRNGDLFLDVESIRVGDSWYGVEVVSRRIEGETEVDSTIGKNRETAQHVGGGAVIGSILGAIVGGRKGAAVGAVAGAGVGAVTQIHVRGEFVQLPAESLVTFRLDSPLTIGWKDRGREQGGDHYHGDDDRR